MFKKKHDVEKELAKYRHLIDEGYVDDNNNDDMDYDIMKFCLKKKIERDVKTYGKIRSSFFDNLLNIFKKK